ncbi:MAG: hypothetical protein IJV37_08720 [Bacteroidales bacterium]|nr:hypothetical protein [Bacteroidales bacterium]
MVLNSTCLFAKLPDSWFFRHFRLGAEWGYSQCLYRSWSYNYFSEEGYRVYDDQQGWLLRPNGSVFLQIGYDLSAKVNVALNAGYLGTGENNRLLPVLLRLSYFPKTTTADGLFGWVQGGPALHFHTEERPVAWTESLGAGYRIALTEECNLDFLLGVRLTQDHPLIPNPEAPGYVSRHNILKNNAGYCALDLTIAVNF